MDQRKLIKLGNSSFAIALPKDWVNKSGLKKGDNVFIVPNSNGELMISPQFRKVNGGKRIGINVDGKNEEEIRREFITAYINGNSIFQFNGTMNKEKNKNIKQIIKDYIGCEVTEENEKKLVVKDFFNLEDIDLNNFIKRTDNNIKEMFDIIIEGIKKGKFSNSEMKNIKETDLDINKLYFLTSRIMTMGLNNPALINALKISPPSLLNNWWLIFHLEHIGDGIKEIAKILKTKKINKETTAKLFPILNQVKKLYIDTLKTFYAKDKEEAHQIMEEGRMLLIKCDKLTKNDDLFLSLIGEKLKNIENDSYQITKIILNFEE